MSKFLKICGIILLFAVAVELSPLLILALIVLFICTKGDSTKDKANKVLDKTKKIINC